MSSKVCKTCKKNKSISEYYRAERTRDGRRGSCRYCDMDARRKRLAKADPDQRRSVVLKNKYGITLEDYEKMSKNQGGRCHICKTDDYGKKGLLVVDHCHSTGSVRGLLCYSCNIALGLFKDNISVLRDAITYLENK